MKKYLLPLGLASLVLFEGCNGGNPPPPQPATHFSVIATANATAGTAFSITVTALDASNGVASSYSGTVHLTSSDSQAALPSNSGLIGGTGSFQVTLKTAGGQTISASDSTINGSSTTIGVVPAPSQLFVVTPGTTTYVGVPFNITVDAMDAYHNSTSSYSGTVQFKSTDPQASLPAPSKVTNGTGSFSVTLKTSGNQSVTATDSATASITGTSSLIDVQVVGPLLITSGSPPNGVVGQGYGGTHTISNNSCTLTFVGWPLTASGGISGYKWTWSAAPGSSLPAGLTVHGVHNICSVNGASIGVFAEIIGGSPTATGNYNVIVTVTDSASPPNQTSAPYTISILGSAVANDQPANLDKSGHHHYKLIDFGSLGGPGGGIVNPSSRVLNNRGMVVGASDTANPDPFAPDCYLDCNVVRGQLLRNGVVTELPPLSSAPNLSSIPAAINIWGQAVGTAQNGLFDSSTGWPESHGVLWQNGQAMAIPTLGGTQSTANDINDFGQVVGASLTATPDPFANNPLCGALPTTCGTFAMTATFFPGTTESHAFLWHQGFLRDLGTLGGPDSAAWVTNDLGEVAGWSFTSSVPNATTGVPTVDPFFWSPVTGKMVDIGGFGGTFGAAFWMNNSGQVVGNSNLAGDSENHAFFWDHGKLTDLGTLNGGSSEAWSVNDAGEVVGFSTDQTIDTFFAFSWKDGVMRNLGTVDGDECSVASSINSLSQIVGISCSAGVDLHGFLGENGGPIVDLNPLIVPATHLTVVSALFINDRGEIACLVQQADGSNHGCLLVPCDEDHPNVVGCDYSLVPAGVAEAASAAPAHVAPLAQASAATASLSGLTQAERMARMRSMMARRRSARF